MFTVPRSAMVERLAPIVRQRCGFTVLVTVMLCSVPLSAAEPGSADRPNILWLIGENLGADLGCYGAPLVQTPNLDRLASEGMLYTTAIATCPICSPTRSAFMTGMSQISIGAEHHRSHRTDNFQLPDGVWPLTHRLIDSGYFTANIRTIDGAPIGTGKTDLNFRVIGRPLRNTPQDEQRRNRAREEGSASVLHNIENEVRLFESSEWNDLWDNQPFYAQVNFPLVERSPRGWIGSAAHPAPGDFRNPAIVRPEEATPPPYYPDHPVTRNEWANYLNAVCGLDVLVGRILKQLETDGLAENTIVIFFGDNGRLSVRGIDWCYDNGVRVPCIVRWPRRIPAPPQYQPGSVSEQVISLIDLTATTLALAGLEKPAEMQGRILLGRHADPPREYAFSARDRADEAVNRIRSARSQRYRYIRNLMPEKGIMAQHRYKDAAYPVVALMHKLHSEGMLTPIQQALMAPRLPDEEFYDCVADPHETKNLAESSDPAVTTALEEHRRALEAWRERVGDLDQQPEPAEVVQAAIEAAEASWGTAEFRK